MSITSQEVSIVVQGAIDWTVDQRMNDARTRAATRIIRQMLPDAEIILSTWEDAFVDGLTYDKLIRTADPGSQGVISGYTPNNVNRQIISTLAGLRQATRSYCIKIRSDVILAGLHFIHRWAQLAPLPSSDPFRRPILANNLTSRDSDAVVKRLPDHPLLFHPSDHFHFGHLEDLVYLWDIPLQTEADSLFFLDKTQPNRWRYNELSKLTPEQHILTSALKKSISFELKHYADSNPELIELSRRAMNEFFLFMPDLHVPLHFEKYHTGHHFSFEWMRHAPMEFGSSVSNKPVTEYRGMKGIAKRLWSTTTGRRSL